MKKKSEPISLGVGKNAMHQYYSVRQRRRLLFKLVAGAVSFILLVVLGLLLFDKTPPVIVSPELPSAIGENPQSFNLVFKDEGSPIASVSIDLIHAGQRRRILEKLFPELSRQQSVRFSFDAKSLELIDSRATMEIRVTDKALSPNTATLVHTLAVDYQLPELQVLASTKRFAQGDVGWAILDGSDANFAGTGVQVGDQDFQSYPAYLLDSSATDFANLSFSFFAKPFFKTAPTVVAYAKDAAGNLNEQRLFSKLVPGSSAQQRVDYDAALIAKFVDPLIQQSISSGVAIDARQRIANKRGVELLKAKFQIVAGDYLAWANDKLSENKTTASEALWKPQGFSLPKGSVLQRRFAQTERIFYADAFVFERMFQGDFLSTTQTVIRSIARGQVIFSGNLGPYGEVIEIDHGFGISSVYAHLQQRNFAHGEFLEKGVVIGTPGKSGLSPLGQVELQIRVSGVSVDPSAFLSGRGFIATFESQLQGLLQTRRKQMEEKQAAQAAASFSNQ